MTFHHAPNRFAQFAATSLRIFDLLLAADSLSAAQERFTTPTRTEACADDNGGITLPAGFTNGVPNPKSYRSSMPPMGAN